MSILDKYVDDVELGSIMRFLYDIEPCRIYQDGIPENFEVPSIYIPTPNVNTENFSNDAYQVFSSLQMKIFGKNDAYAASHAKVIVETIRNNRELIPMYAVDGSKLNSYLKVTKVEWRPIEDCVVNMTLEWNFIYNYTKIASENKIDGFSLSSIGIKTAKKDD